MARYDTFRARPNIYRRNTAPNGVVVHYPRRRFRVVFSRARGTELYGVDEYVRLVGGVPSYARKARAPFSNGGISRDEDLHRIRRLSGRLRVQFPRCGHKTDAGVLSRAFSVHVRTCPARLCAFAPNHVRT